MERSCMSVSSHRCSRRRLAADAADVSPGRCEARIEPLGFGVRDLGGGGQTPSSLYSESDCSSLAPDLYERRRGDCGATACRGGRRSPLHRRSTQKGLPGGRGDRGRMAGAIPTRKKTLGPCSCKTKGMTPRDPQLQEAVGTRRMMIRGQSAVAGVGGRGTDGLVHQCPPSQKARMKTARPVVQAAQARR